MEITLNHTIVPAFNHIETAKFYEFIFEFKFLKVWGPFAVVKVNSSLTLDFKQADTFNSVHFAFKVSEKEFDNIFNRIKSKDIPFGSDPFNLDDHNINTNYNGRGVYFKDPNDHVLEIITTDYIID